MYKLALLVAVVAACWGNSKPAEAPHEPAPIANTEAAPRSKPAPPPLTEVQQVMAQMRQFADEMCACNDAACAKNVSDDMTKWAMAQSKTPREPVQMTDEEQKAATELGTRMGECMQKAMSAGGSTP